MAFFTSLFGGALGGPRIGLPGAPEQETSSLSPVVQAVTSDVPPSAATAPFNPVIVSPLTVSALSSSPLAITSRDQVTSRLSTATLSPSLATFSTALRSSLTPSSPPTLVAALSTPAAEAASASATGKAAESHISPALIIVPIVAGVLLALLIAGFCLVRWRRRQATTKSMIAWPYYQDMIEEKASRRTSSADNSVKSEAWVPHSSANWAMSALGRATGDRDSLGSSVTPPKSVHSIKRKPAPAVRAADLVYPSAPSTSPPEQGPKDSFDSDASLLPYASEPVIVPKLSFDSFQMPILNYSAPRVELRRLSSSPRLTNLPLLQPVAEQKRGRFSELLDQAQIEAVEPEAPAKRESAAEARRSRVATENGTPASRVNAL